MSINVRGRRLVFLVSQPRAGSTLLQRILGSHPDVHTVSEPWLMLHPIYALRSNGADTEYDASLAREALSTFLQGLPEGVEAYFEGTRRMYGYLYRRALEVSGKRYFLDKTPRYYLILQELHRAFPEAQYIILFRNPLGVLCSMLTTWVREDWLSLTEYAQDLTRAPQLLLEGRTMLQEQARSVRYEDLVQNPEAEVRRLCRKLQLDFAPGMIEYGQSELPHWDFGDQDGVYRDGRPTVSNVSRWVQGLENPQVWRLAREYLQLLGPEIVERMGYDFVELREMLKMQRPSWLTLAGTFSLHWLLEKPREERTRWERVKVKTVRTLRQRGIRGTASTAAQRAGHALSGSE